MGANLAIWRDLARRCKDFRTKVNFHFRTTKPLQTIQIKNLRKRESQWKYSSKTFHNQSNGDSKKRSAAALKTQLWKMAANIQVLKRSGRSKHRMPLDGRRIISSRSRSETTPSTTACSISPPGTRRQDFRTTCKLSLWLKKAASSIQFTNSLVNMHVNWTAFSTLWQTICSLCREPTSRSP